MAVLVVRVAVLVVRVAVLVVRAGVSSSGQPSVQKSSGQPAAYQLTSEETEVIEDRLGECSGAAASPKPAPELRPITPQPQRARGNVPAPPPVLSVHCPPPPAQPRCPAGGVVSPCPLPGVLPWASDILAAAVVAGEVAGEEYPRLDPGRELLVPSTAASESHWILRREVRSEYQVVSSE